MDILYKFWGWYANGDYSSNGKAFDIGKQTYRGMQRFKILDTVFDTEQTPNGDGNGSIMRLAPIPMFYRRNLNVARTMAKLSSMLTHGNKLPCQTAELLTIMTIKAFDGKSKESILDFTGLEFKQLDERLKPIIQGAYKSKTETEIKTTGYCLDTIEAAVWAFQKTNSFEDGLILVVNMGDDADTVGAVYGQLAGAFYGMDKISYQWVTKLVKPELIDETAIQLLNCSTFIDKDTVFEIPKNIKF